MTNYSTSDHRARSIGLADLILVRPMKRVLTFVLLCVGVSISVAAPYHPSPAQETLMKRAFALTGKAGGYLYYIPPKGDLGPSISKLAATATLAKSNHQPLIIYSPDAERAKRVTTIVLAAVRPNAFRGLIIICAVGVTNDSYIRPVVEATGAKLYVEPLP
jgi:hypothetical protein